MARQPQAAECGCSGGGTEDNSAGQARLEELGAAGAPRENIVDLESNADAEQQRQRNDVGEIERQPCQNTDLQRQDAGHYQRNEREQHIAEPTQRNHKRMVMDPSAHAPACMNAARWYCQTRGSKSVRRSRWARPRTALAN